MELIRDFEDLNKNDVSIAGGKGASLGEMTCAGIPVPPGFVVLSGAFEQFLEESDLNVEIDAILQTVNTKEMHTVEHASEKIQALILATQMPENIRKSILEHYGKLNAEFVAVRSSATAEDSASAAWAGQLDSFLNTAEAELLKNVQRCWASLFTPRAIFYRFEKELYLTKISVAVVIQKMVQSEFSGIAFSVHPVTEDRNQLIIEAGFGLGEAIVSGQVTPDSYVVEKSPRKILDINVSVQKRALYRASNCGNEWRDIPEPKASSQVLSEQQILELSDLIIKIENHYGFPCDIEWAFEFGKFYITQSRPITTLSRQNFAQKKVYEKAYTRENSLIAFQIWEEHQTKRLQKILDWVAEPAIFDVTEGVAGVYYKEGTFDGFDTRIAAKQKTNPQFVQQTMHWYGELLNYLESKWHSEEPLQDLDEFLIFYDKVVEAWCGLDVSYEAPKSDVAQEVKDVAMCMRERAADFLEENDHVIQRTLRKLYPDLGDLIAYLRIEEVKGGEPLPSTDALRKRQKHYVYYKNEISYNSLPDFLQKNALDVKQEKIIAANELTGQTAMGGKVTGRVRLLAKKAQIAELQEGEILVTAMTTPDYLPAMHKAAAFITDEGGITCHAAIIARELRKPCVIGTKFATQIIKDGDMVEVDADNGVVRILKSGNMRVAKIQFKKSYSRDTTLFMQVLWARGLTELPNTKWGWQNTHLPFVAHFVNDGVVEIWEHEPAIAWFLDTLLTENKNGPSFLRELLEEYQGLLARLSTFHDKDSFSNHDDMHLYVELVYQAAFAMTMFFYTGMDERSPKEVQVIAVEAREAADFFAENDVFVRKHITRMTGLSQEHAGVVLPEELINLPTVALLDKRLAAYLMIDGKEMWTGVLSSFMETHPQYNFKSTNSPDAEIPSQVSGQAAFKGVVKGRVSIVRKMRDMEKVSDGDILVSPMTTPDFLPAMQRAAAFVTNEGGVTCHAAIVAREMKKPCVIGTRIATHIFKDGDLVEVNAEDGIVRIIERV